MKTLKQIFLEAVDSLKFSGILKLALDPNTLQSVKKLTDELPPDANPLKEKDLHITLVHQDVLKPYRQQLKSFDLSSVPPPQIVMTDKVYKLEKGGRTSWVSVLANQQEMAAFVNKFLQSLGLPSNPENRVYHITIANATGLAGDSVSNIHQKDIIGKNLVSNVIQDSDNDVR